MHTAPTARKFLLDAIRLITVLAILLNALPLPAYAASEQPLPAAAMTAAAAGFLPAWMDTPPSASLLPGWMAEKSLAPTDSLLPSWYQPAAADPAAAQPAPAARPKGLDIPLSLLPIQITGPAVASLGSPIAGGELYTAVIRNNSTLTAYNYFLSADFPTYFTYDNGSLLTGSSGNIPVTALSTAGLITWTPTVTQSLGPGGVITLNFRLRAACNAQSGQMMRIHLRYNANATLPSTEDNASGLNITTGRGNMVIKKIPALQSLGAPDFGKPITWQVTVQNTGLGVLYNAVVTDTGGINLSQPGGDLVPSAVITSLGINQIQTFTVVGQVQACNFTNIAQGAWLCGNQAGDATITNPLTTTASILFAPTVPQVNLSVSTPITEPYCNPITRTVTLTVANPGGPAGNFRIDSTFESDPFWQLLTGTVSSGWQYFPATGIFSYTAGSPTGTVAGASGPLTLTFQIRPPAGLCTAGTGTVAFTPLYNDVCSSAPFTGTPAVLNYNYAQDGQPTLYIEKIGPAAVNVGDVFTYSVTLWGDNQQNISGTILVTDIIPAEFTVIGPIAASAGSTIASGQYITWTYDPPATPGTYSETLTYVVQAITTTGGVCGASQRVNNFIRAGADPICPGCARLYDDDSVTTIIQNNEGVSIGDTSSGSTEVCGAGDLTISRNFNITNSQTITWAGSIFTEALGTPIGSGALPGPTYLQYVTGSLILTINGVDYSGEVTPVVNGAGQLVIDLSALELAVPAVPTQNVTLIFTYTAHIPEGILSGAVDLYFYDWAQLYMPGISDQQACAANLAFNQALNLHIGRGDLSVNLAPAVLDRCGTNTVTLTLNDNTPGRYTDHEVVTFTASSEEIRSARDFVTGGSLPDISGIAIDIDDDIGGGRGIITFTFDTAFNQEGNGTIQFLIDLGCTGGADWHSGITYQSLCGLTHNANNTLAHAYRSAGLILFATPIRYTVRQKTVLWKFFVTNNGNAPAASVVVTNYLTGLAVTGYQASAGVSLSGTLPITTPTSAVFTITDLQPGEMRVVTVTAEVLVCAPLYVNLEARQDCFGESCTNPQARVDFDTPDPYLLTNNGETADLPMCDIGEVVFTTKNASADVSLYELTITETLRGLLPVAGAPFTMSIYDENQQLVVQTTAFTPVQTYVGPDLLLIWRVADAPAQVITWFQELPPLYVIRIQVPVRTDCTPPATPQSYASATALGPCGHPLGYTEDAVTLRTLQPDMTILKEGAVAGGSFGKRVYAEPGDTIVWRITVLNRLTDRSYVAHNVVLSDTWPYNFEFVTASTNFTPTILPASRTITWAIGDMLPGFPEVFYITGTVGMSDTSCSPQTQNLTQLKFGCDNGCASSLTPIDTADLGSQPDLQLILDPTPINICSGDIPMTIRNYGVDAYSTTFTLTVPLGYVYDSIVSADLAPTTIFTNPSQPRFYWDTIPGRPDLTNPYELNLVVRLRNSGAAGAACPTANGLPLSGTLQYENHPVCISAGPFYTNTAINLNVQQPVISLFKSPHNQTADVGNPVTWTIVMTNIGTGPTGSILITDVAGTNYGSLTATVGSDGAVPVIAGNQITWLVTLPLTVNQVWTATVYATMLPVGVNLNQVTATAFCSVGCDSAQATSHAHTTLLQQFGKYPKVQTGTIGSLVVFTYTAALPDTDALYEGTTFTDSLPTGLGYIDSHLEYDIDTDNTNQHFISNTPTLSPTFLQTGDIVWALGDLSGTVLVNAVITAFIRDIPANQSGVSVTNRLTMTYVDDTTSYIYTDTARVDIVQPTLVINKMVNTSTGGVTNLDGSTWLTYTILITNTGTSPAYDVMVTDTLPSGISVTALFGGDARSNPIQGPGILTWTVTPMSETLFGTNNPLILTYTARISGTAPNISLTNRVSATWTSQPGNPYPGQERVYPVISDTETITTAPIVFTKAVMPVSGNPATPLRIGDIVTYTLAVTVPAGLTIPWPFMYDDLPAGIRYVVNTFQTASTMGFIAPDPLAAGASFDSNPNGVAGSPSATNPRVGTSQTFSPAREALEWWLDPFNNSTNAGPGYFTATFQAQLTGIDLTGAVIWTDPQTINTLNNVAQLYWNNQNSGAYNSTLPTQNLNSNVNSYVGQPLLHINKTYTTPLGCSATLLEDSFNRASTTPPTGWTAAAGTWNQNATPGYAQQSVAAAGATLLVNNTAVPDDFSYSAMIHATDSASSRGLVFHYTDNTHYYRAILHQNDPAGTYNIVLEKVNAGTTIIGTFVVTPQIDRWYHMEARYERGRIRIFIDGQQIIDYTDATPLAAGRVGFYANACGANTCHFDDVFVTRLETSGCYIGANDLVTYTLTISNQASMPAYDIVISDVLPSELTYITSTLVSAPAGTALTTFPTPGTGGTITWTANYLSGTSPLANNYTNQTTMKIQVVARVTAGLTANVRFSNQVFLPYYDSQPGAGPTPSPISSGTDADQRVYSDGSHSAALQTGSGTLSKTVIFAPPPTATLGTLVTYTLIVPSQLLSVSLYNVVVTDTLDPRLYIETMTVAFSGTPAIDGIVEPLYGLPLASDPTGDGNGNAVMDLGDLYVTQDNDNYYFAYTVNGDIAAADWGKYAIYIDTTNDGNGGTYDAWTRNVNALAPHRPEYAIYTFVDVLPYDPGDSQIHHWNGTIWDGSVPADAVAYNVTGGRSTIEYRIAKSKLGNPKTFWAEVWSTGGPMSDNAQDTINAPADDWNAVNWTATSNLAVSTPSRIAGYLWNGQRITATLNAIPYGTQALITVTARISHTWPNAAGDANSGDVITNIASMTSTTTPVTTSNTVSTVVGEPDIQLIKTLAGSSSNPAGVDGLAWLTYTIRLTNTGTSPAYSLHITDAVPSGISITALFGGDARSNPVVGPGILTWTLNTLSNVAPGNSVMLTYTARVSEALAASLLTNTVDLLYTSLTETIPGVRPYTETASAVTATTNLTMVKSTTPITLRVGDQVTYNLVYTIPAGLIGMGGTSYLGDYLPMGIWYITNSETLAWTPGVVPVSVTGRTVSVAGGSQVITWSFGNPITSLITAPTVITLSFVAQAVGLRIDDLTPVFTGTTLHTISNTGTLTDRGTIVATSTVTNAVIQPNLTIDKDSVPLSGTVIGAGQLITYTLTVTNSGHGPAYDMVISDTLPAGMTYVTSTIGSSAPPTIAFTSAPAVSATGPISWVVTPLWGTDWNGGAPGTFVITMVAQVANTIIAGSRITNTAALPYYDSQPGTGPGPFTPTERVYTDGTDYVFHLTVLPSLTKTVVPATATLGSRITYVVRLPSPIITAALSQVTVTDLLPPYLVLESLTDGPDGITATNGNAFTVTYALIPAGEERVITVTGILSSGLGSTAGQVITNIAVLTHATGATITPPAIFTVTEPSLVLVKNSTPPASTTVGAGTAVTYSLNLTNSAAITSSPAYDIIVTDTIPSGMRAAGPTLIQITRNGTPVAGTDYAWAFNAGNGQLTITFVPTFTLDPGAGLFIQYFVLIDNNIGAGVALTNQAQTTWSSLPGATPGDRTYGPITDTTTLTTGWPIFSMVKTAATSPITAGDQLTYNIAVTNTGPVNATGIVVTDTVPLSTTYVSCEPGGCTNAGNIVTWTLGTLAPGASTVVTLVVQVATPLYSGTQIVNTGWLTSTQGVTGTSTVTTPVISNHYLDITKTAALTQVAAGGLLTYTLAWTVSGNEPAANVTLSDTLPANTSFITCAGGTGCGNTAGTVLWTLGTVTPTDSGVVTLVVQIASPLYNGTTITNGVLITDSSGLTDTDEITTPVFSSHNIAVTKTTALTQVAAGGLLTYTLVWGVTGNEPAANVTLSDTLPANTTYVSCAGGLTCTLTGSLVEWTMGTLSPTASGVVTLVVQVATPLYNGTPITNGVLITDSSGLTDTDEITLPVFSSHALAITKTTALTQVAPGELLTYTLAWDVTGNEPADNVTISDTIPANTTYVSCAGGTGCSESGGLVLWTLGTVSPTASNVVTLVVRPAAILYNGTIITNGVLITDSSGLTDTDQLTLPVFASHALAITKTTDLTQVNPGDTIIYTLTWGVTGNEPADNVTLSDTVPLSTTYVGCGGGITCTLTGGTVYWTLGTVSPTASGAVTLAVQAASILYSGTQIVNGVLITDSSGLTDTDSVTLPVVAYHAIAVNKTTALTEVAAGGLLTYTLTWAVTGNEPADNVTLSDTLPANTSFITCAGGTGCGNTAGTVLWTLGTVTPTDSGIVTLVVQIASPLYNGTTITNGVLITDSSGLTDTDEITTPVFSSHNIAVTKTTALTQVAAGGLLTYTLAWGVTGNEPADNVTISDTLPANTSYVSCTGGLTCTLTGSLVEWTLGTVSPTASGVVTLVVQVATPLYNGTPITNGVLITDSSGLTDTDEITLPVFSSHALAITKTAALTQVNAGDPLTYTLAWDITGNEPADNVTISDTIPTYATYLSCAGGLTCTLNGNIVEWTFGTISPTASGVVTLVILVNTPLYSGTLIVNGAGITDSTHLTDTDRITTPVLSSHAIAITKTIAVTKVAAGDFLTYTLTWDVTGNEPADNLVISDTTPTSTTFWSAIPVPAMAPTVGSAGTVNWYLGTIDPVTSNSVTMVVRIDSPILTDTTLLNSVIIHDNTNLTDTDSVTVIVVPDTHVVAITKTAALNPVTAGELLTYTLQWGVTGDGLADELTISDTTPAGTTFWSAIPTPNNAPPVGSTGVVNWNLGLVSPITSNIVTMIVRVDAPVYSGTQIYNTVSITDFTNITDTDQNTVTVYSNHGLVVTKTSVLTQVAAGGLLTYTLNYEITGTEPANNVTISDTVPTNTVYVSCAGGVSCSESGGLVIWNLGNIDPPYTRSVTLVVQVASPLYSGTQILNGVLITDSTGLTDTDQLTTPVFSDHTLAITKTAALTQVAPGDILTYTLAWGLTGNEPADNVTISDTVPANAVYLSCAGGLTCTESSGLVLWDLGTLSPTASGVVTLIVQIATPLYSGTQIYNRALITDSTNITGTDQITTPVVASHTLGITKTAALTEVAAGDYLTYTLEWGLTGNEPADNLTISDTLPVNAAYVSCAGGLSCTLNGNTVYWSLGTVSPTASGVVTLIVQIASPLYSGTQILNGAVITDSTNITASDQITTPVISSHALAITKTTAQLSAPIGELITYTLEWGVTGNEPADNVTISDTTPISTTFWAASPAPTSAPAVGAAGTVLWNLGTVSPTASGIVTLVVRVDSALVSGTLVVNQTIITDSTNLTDTDAVTLPATATANVVIVKSLSHDPVIVGTTLTYTLVYTNEGPSGADNVVVTDMLPAEVTYNGAVPAPTSGPNPLVWNLGTLAAGMTGTINITVTVSPSTTAPFSNNAVISTTTPNDRPDDNTSTVSSTVLIPALEISKEATPTVIVPGMPITYIVRITNTGQVTFSPLVLTDTLPPELHYVVGSGQPADPDIYTPTLVWQNLGTLPPGAITQVTFMVTSTPGALGLFINYVTTTGAFSGGIITETASVPTVVQDPAVLVEKKLIGYDRDIVYPNYLTFTIQITNVGLSTLDVLPMIDIYDPYNLSFVSAQPQPEEPQDDGQLVWYDLTGPAPYGFNRNMAPGDTFLVTTVFTIAHDITTTVNTVVISDGTDTFSNIALPVTSTATITNAPTAVDLLYFQAIGQPGSVRLEWATAMEVDNFGFRILRSTEANPTLASEIVFIPSLCQGNLCGAEYAYTDTMALPNLTYYYWLVDIDNYGNETLHEPGTAQSTPIERNYLIFLPLILREK